MLGLERIGVQSRFILLMLLVSLGSILAIGWIGYRSARAAITNAVQNHLQSVRHSKTSGLMALLESLRDQVISLSDGKLAAEAMVNFKRAYRAGRRDAHRGPGAGAAKALRHHVPDPAPRQSRYHAPARAVSARQALPEVSAVSLPGRRSGCGECEAGGAWRCHAAERHARRRLALWSRS